MRLRMRPAAGLRRRPALWMGLSILGVVLLAGSGLALRFGTAHAASITDTTCTSASYTQDLVTWAGSGTITFDCPSLATIDVSTAMGGPGVVAVRGGLSLTITSIGRPVTLDGAESTNFFIIAPSATLTLSSLTLTNGSAAEGGAIINNGTLTITNSTLSSNTATSLDGGAILNSGGTVTITTSTFLSNTLSGFSTTQDNGGGLANEDGGTATITGSAFTSNTGLAFVAPQGGGAYNGAGSSMTIQDSTFSNNGVPGSGGALENEGTLLLNGSTLSGNGSFVGGGVFNDGTVTITDSTVSDSGASDNAAGLFNHGVAKVIASTFSGNHVAVGDGGGLYNDGTLTILQSTIVGNHSGAGGGGAGVANEGGTMVLANSTVTGNSTANTNPEPDIGGGGLYNRGGATAALTNVTLTANAASPIPGGGIANVAGSTVVLTNSIVAGNPTGANCATGGGFVAPTDGDYNLTDLADNSCAFSAASHDALTGAPGLGSLGTHGGPTQTIPLLSGSPAIDAGNDSVCAASPVNGVDQRGVHRPQGAHCDIGAYERAPATTTYVTANPNPSTFGQSVQVCATVAAVVSGSGTPTGLVTFTEERSLIGTGTLVNGSVCISTTALKVGKHTIAADYGGDSQFDPSTGSVDDRVRR